VHLNDIKESVSKVHLDDDLFDMFDKGKTNTGPATMDLSSFSAYIDQQNQESKNLFD